MNEMAIRGRVRRQGFRWRACVALVAVVGALSPCLARSQATAAAGRGPGGDPCPDGMVGFLGITLLDCRGDCSLTLDDGGRSRAWFFSVEPRISELAPNSPAERSLRIGDRIVAIDDRLITTPEGGRRFANIDPEQTVTLRYRRKGEVRVAALRAAGRCGPAVDGVSALPPNKGPTADDPASASDVTWAGPGMLIERWNTTEGLKTRITLARSHPSPRGAVRKTADGDGHLGMNIGCGPCSETFRNGLMVHRFSNPIDVVGVEVGGPADRAGIRAGERITAINGLPIDTRAGGEAYSFLRPGQVTKFTVVDRHGQARIVTVVPD